MQYCGACGTRLASYLDAEQKERWRCPECGWRWIDVPYPVVLVLGVTPDGRILYTRRHSWPEGRWGLVAGFVERSESAEAAAAREVLEETGLGSVGEPEFVRTVPFRETQLLLCFRVRLVQGEPRAGSDAEVVDLAPPDPARTPAGSPAQQLVDWHLAHPLSNREGLRRSALRRSERLLAYQEAARDSLFLRDQEEIASAFAAADAETARLIDL